MTGTQDWTRAVEEAARVIAAGGVVGYPTETVWGLAARADAAERLYAVKGRDAAKAVQVSCGSAEVARTLAQVGEVFEALSGLWPGPLTLVLPAAPACPPDLAPGGWVGIRIPDHPVALALLRACGGFLATTSLNPSGGEAARTHAQAEAYGLAECLLPDADPPASGTASTVVRVFPSGELEVLREGALPVGVLRGRLAAQGRKA